MRDQKLQLKRDVMMRVYTIHFLRKLTRPFYVELILFTGFLVVLFSTVSVYHVFLNMFSSGGNVVYFLKSAFYQSGNIVKFALIAECLVALALLRDVFKNLPALVKSA